MSSDKRGLGKSPSLLCKTKYPIMLVHGVGSRERKHSSCWGRIPKALENEGAEIFCSNQDAWGTIEENAGMVKESILAVLSKTGHKKVNVIALSKGGLEVRYMIHQLEMGDKIASLTTISTPHNGSKTMDYLYRSHKYILKLIDFIIDPLYRLLGDKNPDFYSTCHQFTTARSERFNHEILNSSKVIYQSYASIMKKPYSDMLLFIPHIIVKLFDGECDGIVSIDSAKWGVFKGVITGKGIRGISHSDLRDIRKMDLFGMNIRGIYIDIVNNLKQMGL